MNLALMTMVVGSIPITFNLYSTIFDSFILLARLARWARCWIKHFVLNWGWKRRIEYLNAKFSIRFSLRAGKKYYLFSYCKLHSLHYNSHMRINIFYEKKYMKRNRYTNTMIKIKSTNKLKTFMIISRHKILLFRLLSESFFSLKPDRTKFTTIEILSELWYYVLT